MKKGQVIKSQQTEITENDLALINNYTRRNLSAEEVYVFSVVLCDNDIDRDYERFTVESLFALEKLFVGKTGIFDHDVKANNQTARIFACKVEAVDGKKTATGDDYFRLVARAYIPKSEKNSDIILSLDSGIIKEVSVGCAVEKVICSICSNEIHSPMCNHTKGNEYGSKMCYGELVSPYDAYEFSFVAVPAQKQAGVIKAFGSHVRKDMDMNMDDILKAIKDNKELTLNKEQCCKLRDYICQLENTAKDGRLYRQDLEKSVVRLSSLMQNDIKSDTMKGIVSKLDISELKELKKVYSKRAEEVLPLKPQLYSENKSHKNSKNTQFTI